MPVAAATGTIGAEEKSVMRMLYQAAVQEGEPAGAPAAPAAISPLMRDFLTWVVGGPRSYTDAMEAWRSSCPRFTIWEDALGDGLIAVERGAGRTMRETEVVLTPRGRAVLAGQ